MCSSSNFLIDGAVILIIKPIINFDTSDQFVEWEPPPQLVIIRYSTWMRYIQYIIYCTWQRGKFGEFGEL